MIRSKHPIPVSDPAGTGLAGAGDGKMWLDRRFRSRLAAADLSGFEAVMVSSEGQCLRVLEDRENWRLELPSDGPKPQGLYLKRHHVRTLDSRIRAGLGSEPGESAGRVEARNVRRLTDDGIACMELVAYGETLHGDGRLESFVLTEELEGFLPLDDFLKQRFPAHASGRTTSRDRDLDRLIRRVAEVAGEFHRAGYNHRDLYCCHFFVKEPVDGQFDIKLIDLQRVQHRRRFRRRWLVKDLAQLAFSAPPDRIKCTHRVAFMRRYLGVRKLGPTHKRLIRAVLAKRRRMARKEGLSA